MTNAKPPRTINKDAGTGQIVTDKYASTHPATTYAQTIKPIKKGK